MEQATRKEEELEIDLMELIRVLINKGWIIIICLIVGAGITFGYTKYFITPQYSSSSMIYILSKTTSITSMADLQLGTTLTPDFIVIAKSRPVLEGVIEELDLDMSPDVLSSKISIYNQEDTHILKITVTDPDPELAAMISNQMSQAVADSIAEIMNTDRPNILETALVSSAPSSPNVRRNMMLGGMVGAAAAIAAILLLHMMDDTIHTAEDVRKYLDITVLAEFPLERKNQRKGKAKAY